MRQSNRKALYLLVFLFILLPRISVISKADNPGISFPSNWKRVQNELEIQTKIDYYFYLAIVKLKEYEKFSPVPYKGMSGNLLIGYGHSIIPGQLVTLTEKQAEKLLIEDLKSEIFFVEQDTGLSVKTNPQRTIALAMFTFNVGRGAWSQSTLRYRVLHNLQVDGEFIKWVFINKKKSEHLMKRRIFELFLYS